MSDKTKALLEDTSIITVHPETWQEITKVEPLPELTPEYIESVRAWFYERWKRWYLGTNTGMYFSGDE